MYKTAVRCFFNDVIIMFLIMESSKIRKASNRHGLFQKHEHVILAIVETKRVGIKITNKDEHEHHLRMG